MRLLGLTLAALAAALSATACSALFGVDFDGPARGAAEQVDGGRGPDAGEPEANGSEAGAVPGELRVTSVAVGGRHACALLSDGIVKCWGANERGQLGNGAKTPVVGPVRVEGFPARPTHLLLEGDYGCARLETGAAACWGVNADGQLGDGTKTDQPRPVLVKRLADVKDLAMSGEHACAIVTNGVVKCWGRNSLGELGDGTLAGSLEPVAVKDLTGALDIAAGGARTCALLATGSVRCWGFNDAGQIESSKANRPVPFEVLGNGSNVSAVSVGWLHTCLRTTTGAAFCRGYNGWGELGDGSFADAWSWSGPTPSVAALGDDVAEVKASLYHSCALRKSDGTLQCWGGNNWGQLGDGSFANRAVPRGIDGLTGRVTSFSTGGSTTCAVVEGGAKVVCWGNDEGGALGAPSTELCGAAPERKPCSSTPLEVRGLL